MLLWHHLDAVHADLTSILVDEVQVETLFADIHLHRSLGITAVTLTNHLLKRPDRSISAERAGILNC